MDIIVDLTKWFLWGGVIWFLVKLIREKSEHSASSDLEKDLEEDFEEDFKRLFESEDPSLIDESDFTDPRTTGYQEIFEDDHI